MLFDHDDDKPREECGVVGVYGHPQAALLVALGLFLLLDGRDDPPRSTAGTNHVLVRDREQVALLDSQLDVHLGDKAHRLDHLFVPLTLLSQLGL